MKILIGLLHLYQRLFRMIRIYMPGSMVLSACKYYPSCSEYSEQALYQYGFVKGSIKSIQRICSCHPWAQGGIDLP